MPILLLAGEIGGKFILRCFAVFIFIFISFFVGSIPGLSHDHVVFSGRCCDVLLAS